MSTGYWIFKYMPQVQCHSKLSTILRHKWNIEDSLTYSRCQQLLLNEEIRCKKRRLRQLMFEYDRIKQELQYQPSPIDFMHVSSLFLVSNYKAIRKNDKIHRTKLQKLIPNIHKKVLLIMFHMILIKWFIIVQIIILWILINRY